MCFFSADSKKSLLLYKVQLYLHPLSKEGIQRELSSAGSEHLPYKQRVTGSNPVAPTNSHLQRWLFSFKEADRAISSVGSEHYLDKVGVTGSSPVLPTS